MGEYYMIFNHTKKERLNPHAFGDGLKFLEWTHSVYFGLGVLLLCQWHSSNSVYIGRWRHDALEVIGDSNREYKKLRETYTDIGKDVLMTIFNDKELRAQFAYHFGNKREFAEFVERQADSRLYQSMLKEGLFR